MIACLHSQAVANHFRPRLTGKRQEMVWPSPERPEPCLGEKYIGDADRANVYVRRVIEEALPPPQLWFWSTITLPVILNLGRRRRDDARSVEGASWFS
jgi:hypothetical protein